MMSNGKQLHQIRNLMLSIFELVRHLKDEHPWLKA